MKQRAFDQYQKSRLQFVQTIADLSNNPQNIKSLEEAQVFSQLFPLMLDDVPSIQHNALLALGRMADHSKELAMIVVMGDVLPQLIQSIPSQNLHYKKTGAFVLRAVAKHSHELSQFVVDCGALEALVLCLEDFDLGVKEAAAWTLGIISQQSALLSQAVVDAGAVPLLVLSLKENAIALKCIAAFALSEISKHTCELAQVVADTGAITALAKMICSPDAKLRKQVLSTLTQISKHSVELAEMVVATNIFLNVMVYLQDLDKYVKKNVITLMSEVVKHSAELSQVIVNCGGLAEVVDYLDKSRGKMRLPGIMTLGYVAAHSENLAEAVILSRGVHQLAVCLSEEDEDHIKVATVWSIGQIGHYTAEHAMAVATAGLLPKLLQLYMEASSSEDLQLKSKKALKDILLKCTHLPSLEPLLYSAPTNIVKHVLGQFSKVLLHDRIACQQFVLSGGLRKVQEMDAEPGSAVYEHITTINSCFPPEVIKYCPPGNSETLLKCSEEYQPSDVDHSFRNATPARPATPNGSRGVPSRPSQGPSCPARRPADPRRSGVPPSTNTAMQWREPLLRQHQ
uniref:Sperm associated antigen 6 n=1 Tax=Gouania willdenowi TaxID=441366 RepID=A0A8C5I3J0_GOUWI